MSILLCPTCQDVIPLSKYRLLCGICGPAHHKTCFPLVKRPPSGFTKPNVVPGWICPPAHLIFTTFHRLFETDSLTLQSPIRLEVRLSVLKINCYLQVSSHLLPRHRIRSQVYPIRYYL